MAEADHVPVRILLEEESGFGQQRIEPSTGLVDRFGYEVGREGLLEDFFALAGIGSLRKRHRAGVEPRVHHFRYSMHVAATLLTRQGHLVDVGPVKVGVVLQADLGGRADAALLVASVADPDGHRRAPVAAP